MLLKLSAAYAMFVELIVVVILVYLQLEVKEIVILGIMSYATFFFFGVWLLNSYQMAK